MGQKVRQSAPLLTFKWSGWWVQTSGFNRDISCGASLRVSFEFARDHTGFPATFQRTC